jgi:hypothetical protein
MALKRAKSARNLEKLRFQGHTILFVAWQHKHVIVSHHLLACGRQALNERMCGWSERGNACVHTI